LREKKWPYPQLGGWSPDGFAALAGRAGLKFKGSHYDDIAAKFANTNRSERMILLLPPDGLVK
jgi:hypothetical protein